MRNSPRPIRDRTQPRIRRGATVGALFLAGLGAAALLAPAKLAAQDASAALVGEWTGALSAGGQSLRLIVTVEASDAGALSGALTSVDQGNVVLDIDTITIEDGTVRFSISAVDGSYEGTMSAAGTTIDGTWTQLGQSIALALERTPDP